MSDLRQSSARFETTRWSVVDRAGGDDSLAHDALAELCGAYWPPVYAFLRRRGHDPVEAEERCQAFFCMLLERDLVARADVKRGRFRSFLLGCLNHFVADAQRRLAREPRIPFDAQLVEDIEAADGEHSPEAAFERAWARLVLDRSLRRVEEDYRERGEDALFEELRPTLTGGEIAGGYAALSERLGKTEGALRIAAHRLRRRMREELEREVRETVCEPRDVLDEVQELLRALSA